MRLLIVTQNVDRTDPILGFFHRWITEFASYCESVTVIGQSVGDYQLPQNVRVLSLGKEKGTSKIRQVLRYRWLLWNERHAYDAILVHMTPIWAVLGWRAVAFLKKRMYLWYEARGARWPLKISLWIVRKAFSASAHGMPIDSKKSVITGHGIDTERFAPGTDHRDSHLLITIGRLTKAKNLPAIIEAIVKLPPPYHLRIVGKPITSSDKGLLWELTQTIAERDLNSRIDFLTASHDEVPHLLRTATLFLHAAKTSLDKALLEAMASGCLVVSSSSAAADVLPAPCFAPAAQLGDRAQELLRLPQEEQEALRHELRQIVVHEHGLPRLIERLVKEMR